MSDELLPPGNTSVFQLLSIFASAFATAGATLVLTGGGYVLGIAALAFAVFLFIVGLKWSSVRRHAGQNIVLMVDKLAQYRNTVVLFIVAGLLIYGIHFVYNLRSDINKYVMPRTITSQQSDALQEYSSHHDKYPVRVKVFSLDGEAREYAAQLSNALNRANWDATFDTSGEPNSSEGLCINTTGENVNPKPFDAKHDPKTLLQQALTAADIRVNCGGGSGAGEYKLYLLVGHRPVVVGDQEPLLSKVGRWIAALSR